STYLVTLNMRSSRTQRSTETPNGGITSGNDQGLDLTRENKELFTGIVENPFEDGADHHKTVESVEKRKEVTLEAERVHLQQHFEKKQGDKHQIGSLYNRSRRN